VCSPGGTQLHAPAAQVQVVGIVVDDIRGGDVDAVELPCDGCAKSPELSEATIIDEVTALMIERHPEWEGWEWIQPAVSCPCSEHAS